MFDLWHFILFLSAAGVLALMPGPGIFYVAARTLAGGRGEGLASSFGTGLGGFVHIIAGAVGASALVMASAQAFTVLKFVGALYLVYLGIKTWREAGTAPELGNGHAIGARKAFKEGVIVEALNPKTAAFFLAFLPQFVDRDAPVLPQTLTLAAIHVVVGLVWLSGYARLVDRARGVLTEPRVKAWLERTTGAVLIAFGLRVAVERR